MNLQAVPQMQNLPLPSESLDYDLLVKLAQDDPAAYEAFRQQMIERLITAVPNREQARLRGLQFQIDQRRHLAHTPLGATVSLYDMMWRAFLDMNNELSGRRYTKPVARKSAKVLSLQRKLLGTADKS